MNYEPSASSPAPASDRLFFRYILENGPSSRAKIATEHNLSRPTASEAASRLMERGYIQALAKDAGASGKRGRVPELYDIADTLGCTLAVSAEIDCFRGAIYNLRGEQLAQVSVPTSWESNAVIQQALETLIDELVKDISLPVLAGTVAVVSPVNPNTQQLGKIPDLGYHDQPLDFYSYLTERFNCPVMVDDRINWVLLNETRKGIAQHAPVVLGIHLDEGISAALAVNGRLYRGASGRNGLIHLVTAENKSLRQRLQHLGVVDEHSFIRDDGGYLNFEKTAERIVADPESENSQLYLMSLAESIVNAAIITDPSALLLTGPAVENKASLSLLTELISEKYPWHDLNIIVSEDGARAIRDGVREGSHLLAMVRLGLSNPHELGLLYPHRPINCGISAPANEYK